MLAMMMTNAMTVMTGSRPQIRHASRVVRFSLSPTFNGNAQLLSRGVLLLLAASVPRGAAAQICHTDANGKLVCTNKITPAIGAAIALSILAVFFILLGAFIYIRRVRQRRAQIESTFTVEAGQIHGPPVIAANVQPAYAASYDVHSAPTRHGYGSSRAAPKSAGVLGRRGSPAPKTPSSQTYTTFTNVALRSENNTPTTPFKLAQSSVVQAQEPMWGVVHGPSSAPQIKEIGGLPREPPMTAPGNKAVYPFTGISSNSNSPVASSPRYVPGQGMKSAGLRTPIIPRSAGITSAGVGNRF